MPAKILDGKAIAEDKRKQLKKVIEQRLQQGLNRPGLAVILVGDNPASEVYVKHKRKACAEVGIESMLYRMPSTATLTEVQKVIADCNQNPSIHGILLQLPLPEQLDCNQLIECISPGKDVDGFHPFNLGRLAQKRPALRSCTPKGVMSLLQHCNENLTGKNAVVVGASNIVGRPMALELLLSKCTITLCHRFTKDVPLHIKNADIVILALGNPGVIKPQWIKPGAIVIDVGFTRSDDGKIHGDIEHSKVTQASWITPVPGGVGPMTVISLLENTLQAAITTDKKS